MINKKKVLVILSTLFLMGIIGCQGEEYTKKPINSSIPVTSTPSSNKELLNLSVEDFKKEYAKLPDDYKIEIGNFKYCLLFTGNTLLDKDIISKKEAEQVDYFILEEEEEELFHLLSLKGLRFFSNVEKIELMQVRVKEIGELCYLFNLQTINFMGCKLGTGASMNQLQGLSKMKKINITMTECRLKNIDFLKYFEDLKGCSLDFSQNQITDISGISGIEYANTVCLSGNRIQDITSLSGLKEVYVLDLSDNKVSNLSPLGNLKRVDKLLLENNKISNLSPLKNIKYIFNLSLQSNVIQDIRPLFKFSTLKELNIKENPIKDISQLTKFKVKDMNGKMTVEY